MDKNLTLASNPRAKRNKLDRDYLQILGSVGHFGLIEN